MAQPEALVKPEGRQASIGSPESSQMPAGLRRLVDSTLLVSPSKSLILSCGEIDHAGKEKKLEELVVVNMTGHYLINLGYLTNCPALTICILPRNYIMKIDALSNCPHLIKLDLHGNHITELPDEDFWLDMKCLQILHLHDNIISHMRNVKSLCACPQLTVLTLFDTPVSLMPNYRQFIVNSIWTLKALDNFVIADKELMEDNLNSYQFRALSHQFFVHPPLPPQFSTWCSEMENIRNLMATINNILAHHSPVHIIQRWIRGHLTRKKLRIASTLCYQPPLPCRRQSWLCSRGIHVLADGRMWVQEDSSREMGECKAVHLHIDLHKLQAGALEDRYEAREITSGIYPDIAHWSRWNSPNLRVQGSNAFKHRTFRPPRFHPSTEFVQLV